MILTTWTTSFALMTMKYTSVAPFRIRAKLEHSYSLCLCVHRRVTRVHSLEPLTPIRDITMLGNMRISVHFDAANE